jgi:hypothetical protein
VVSTTIQRKKRKKEERRSTGKDENVTKQFRSEKFGREGALE